MIYINSIRNWSESDIEKLKKYYEENTKIKICEILKILPNKNRDKILYAAKVLGINKVWSKEEVDYLKRNFKVKKLKELSGDLGRTKHSIEVKLRRLNLLEKKNIFKGDISEFITHKNFNDYKANKKGEIIRFDGKDWIKVIARDNGKGYLNFTLKRKTYYVHRFVAECFIENFNCFPQINHKNEIKTDNRIENLEWCDQKYNNNYGTKIKRASEKKSKKILQIKNNEIINRYSSISITSKFGYNHNAVSNVLTGRSKTHKGYKWKYEEDIMI